MRIIAPPSDIAVAVTGPRCGVYAPPPVHSALASIGVSVHVLPQFVPHAHTDRWQIAAAQSSTGRRGWFLRTRRWRSSPSLDLANTDGWKMAAAQSSTGRRGWFYRHLPTSLWQPLASRYTSETLKPVRTLSTTRTRPLKTSLGRPGIFNVLARSHFTRARTPMGGLTFVCVVGENPMGA